MGEHVERKEMGGICVYLKCTNSRSYRVIPIWGWRPHLHERFSQLGTNISCLIWVEPQGRAAARENIRR